MSVGPSNTVHAHHDFPGNLVAQMMCMARAAAHCVCTMRARQVTRPNFVSTSQDKGQGGWRRCVGRADR
eukprot:12701736-Alexandrium_andersonii.AAC.1